MSENNDKIQIYVLEDGYWAKMKQMNKRSLNTIYLEKEIKDEVIDDVKNFISPETKQAYANFGIPYHRTFCFEGIPGTGKTSFIHALASYLNMGISILHFNSSMNDTDLIDAMQSAPPKTIISIEDIDCLFVDRKESDQLKNSITLSGLLNALDGHGYAEEQLTFITTNHIEHLDKALTRQGRIDKIVHFNYCTKKQIQMMYLNFFPQRKDFNKFYAKIKTIKITTAMLTSYLFTHRNEENLTTHIDELVKMSTDMKPKNSDMYL